VVQLLATILFGRQPCRRHVLSNCCPTLGILSSSSSSCIITQVIANAESSLLPCIRTAIIYRGLILLPWPSPGAAHPGLPEPIGFHILEEFPAQTLHVHVPKRPHVQLRNIETLGFVASCQWGCGQLIHLKTRRVGHIPQSFSTSLRS